ncbi:hypothetical protein QZH41_009968 [Actinostola sp. cb2023]|nr:hypothetical protein QZH41_009968 [Actinostola sp. cb2023]
MTATELAKHDGSDPSVPIYIAILGRVYDVDKGRRHYGKDSGYNVFAGRDSTPSFVTGVFSREKATDDVTGLSPEEMLGIKEWMDFYRKDYTYLGKVIGRYYNENGKPTSALKEAKALIKEGKLLREKQKDDDKKFPPCNSKWSQNEGAEVWCSQESGGIHRSWEGVPRQLFKPGSRDPKCVCVRTTGASSDTLEGSEGDLNHPNIKLYPGCNKMDISCKIQS